MAARPRQTQNFIGTLLGIRIGAVGGGMVGSLFGSDNLEQINTINENLKTVNKKVKITNKRLDVLTQNVANAMKDIKVILDRIQKMTSDGEKRQNIIWNLEQIVDVVSHTELLFKLGETSMTLLRKGFLNLDLVEVGTVQKILEKGIEAFPDLESPKED